MLNKNPNHGISDISTLDLYSLSLKISQYRFTLRAIEKVSIPELAGSMLRGSFGWALRGITCVTQLENCSECAYYDNCQYPKLFNPKPNELIIKQFPSIPAPYLFNPPFNTDLEVEKNKEFSFDLTLFGENSISQLPLIILAWHRAAMVGLGKGKSCSKLIKVEHIKNQSDIRTIYTPNNSIEAHNATINLNKFKKIKSLTLKLVTPTRIQYDNRLISSHQLTAPIFLNTLQRKVLLYLSCYLDLSFDKLPLDENIHLKANLSRKSFYRYSNRQKQKMNLEGLVGTVFLEGDLTSWLPIIQLGQYTHIGKNTSFGLGRYEVIQVNGKSLQLNT